MNNHEGEEDENSGYKIHEHLKHQNHDVQRSQGPFFVIVTEEKDISKIHLVVIPFIGNSLKPDFDDRTSDGYEGEGNG